MLLQPPGRTSGGDAGTRLLFFSVEANGVDAVVVLDVDCHGDAIELVLVNLGPGVARDVHISFSDPLVGIAGSRPIAELPLWTHLRTLRPGKEIRVLLDSVRRLADDEACNSFTADVTWTGATGKHEARYEHDLEAFRHIPELLGPERKID